MCLHFDATRLKILGKQLVGRDIPNGKRTLMLVHALSHVNEAQKKRLAVVVGNEKASQQDVLGIIDIFHEIGSIEYAQNVLREFRDKTKACLGVLDQSESKDLLSELAEYSFTRTY